MSVQQISVFTQSEPGHLLQNLLLLKQNRVSIRGFCCSDSGDYGIARFVVDKPDHALEVLKEHQAACTSTEIVVFALEDEPGKLSDVFQLLSDKGINIAYCYSLIATYIAIKVAEIAEVEKMLTEAHIKVINQDDLANL